MTRILQVSDIHFGVENTAALEAFDAAFTAIGPDALIVAGDLTQSGKRREFAAAAAWLDQYDVPQLVVPGNHDTPLWNMVDRVARPFERFNDMFGHKTAPISVGKFKFAGLNTARGWQARPNWAQGSVNMDDLHTAIEAAKTHDDGAIMGLVCHHPFIPPPNAPLTIRTSRGEAAHLALQNSHISLLLSGHVHTPSVYDVEGYTAVTSGTLSLRLRAVPPSFTVLESHDLGLSITHYAYTDGSFNPV